jgi:hypothetical protein
MQNLSDPRKLHRFWLEFSTGSPRLGGVEKDEGLEVHGRPFAFDQFRMIRDHS